MDFSSLLAAFASAFTQDQRLLSLQLGDDQQWDGVLLPQSVEGSEAVSDSYRYTVDCLSANGNLPLKNLLGLSARLAIQDQNGEPVLRGGVVSQAQALGSDGGFSRYRLVIVPPIALLTHRVTSRVFQDQSVPDIVKQVIAEHQANNPVFTHLQTLVFQLSGQHAPRSYTLQYRESDYDFLRRLMHEEGLAWRFEHVSSGSTLQSQLTVFDDPFSLPQSAQQRVRFQRADATESEDGLTDWQAQRQLTSGQVSLASFDYKAVQTGHGQDSSTRALSDSERAAQSTLEDYQPQTLYYASDADGLTRYAQQRQQAHDLAAQGFQGGGTLRGLHAGHWFRLDNHPAHDSQPADQREFVVTKQQFNARNNLPEALKQSLSSTPDSAPFTTQFNAQPRGLPLSPPYANTALAKPTAPGVQTATVVGPADQEVFTDESGRIKIQLHWQRGQEHPEAGAASDERSSCWIRVAMPSAGAGWGHQFIPRIGQEVLVDFIEGDIDRPVVTGVLYNGSHTPAQFSGAGNLPGNKTLSGIKSKEHQGSGFGELLFDDTSGQTRTRLSNEHGSTQLNQGFLTHPRIDGKAEPRGEGFELRTDLQGAIRAAKGLLLSTHAQAKAKDGQLAREELVGLLEMALSMAQSLSSQADTHQADPTDTAPQQQLADDIKQWHGGSNTAKDQAGGGKAILALGAPQGIAIASEASIQQVSGGSHDVVTVKDHNLTIGQHFRLRVGQSLSLFAQQLGMKLIAAAGKIRIQAQSDDIEIGAAKKLHLYALEELILEAPKVTIKASNAGAEYGGGIVTKTTATHQQHAASHSMDGPASVSAAPPNMPQSTMATHEQFGVSGRAGQARPDLRHDVRNGQSQPEGAGSTDGSGATPTLAGRAIDALKMTLKRSG
ncbi:type VI secretion system Vgr family protein [Paludibacterium purpuratum]|uniref:Type VI secretion system secreted protein VgrG n=1 Tax=Paludibacterium purpuratum TaxID=1144873 RepID=A0A4R7AWX9_9NEIS|nr:type VI secretion system Vgr family protein [Paludibacterium purpuratum]TDR72068.1 type VI secretion system secreted protein VgrG [Paludibacterium purpuratum]